MPILLHKRERPHFRQTRNFGSELNLDIDQDSIFLHILTYTYSYIYHN